MAVHKGKAKDVLELLPPLERASSESLREIFNLQTGLGVTMNELRKMLRGEGRAAALPIIGILPPQKGGEETQTAPFVSGTAIFKKDKMIDQINLKTTRGAMWLRQEIQDITVMIKMGEEKGFMAVKPILGNMRLLPQIDKGKWKMRVKIRAEGDLVQNGTNLDPMDPKVIKDIEQALNKQVKSRIQQTLSKVQKEMKADIFGFGTEFHRVYPKEWGKVEDNWDEVFPDVQVKLEVETYIRRPGMSTMPAGKPKEDMEE
jgi:spore germination protein KC